MKGAFLKTKLINQLKAEAIRYDIELEYHLSNIQVNGDKRGCSGHVINKGTGVCVYIDTEGSCLSTLAGKSMYRLAANIKDYSSNALVNGYNRWTVHAELAAKVVGVLMTEQPKYRYS